MSIPSSTVSFVFKYLQCYCVVSSQTTARLVFYSAKQRVSQGKPARNEFRFALRPRLVSDFLLCGLLSFGKTDGLGLTCCFEARVPAEFLSNLS